MEQSQFIGISEDYVIEVLPTPVSYNTNETVLHILDSEDGVLVVNSDNSDNTTKNTRNVSFLSNVNGTNYNYLLTTTPYSYANLTDSDNFNDSKFLVNGVVPDFQQEYLTCRLHIRSGVGYSVDEIANSLSCWVDYNNRKIELFNLFNHKATSNFVANSSTIYYRNDIYASYIEFNILNIDDIVNNNNVNSIALKKELFGLSNENDFIRSSLSNYQFSHTIVDTSEYVTENLNAVDGNTYAFNKFTTSETLRVFKSLSDNSGGLSNNIRLVSLDETNAVQIEFLHGTLSLEQAFKKIAPLDYIRVEHTVITTEFENTTNIGVSKTVYSKNDNIYSNVRYIPIINKNTTTMQINVRSTIRTNEGIEINRYSNIEIDGSLLDQLRQHKTNISLTVESSEILNKTVKEQIIMNSMNTNSVRRTNVNLSNYTEFTRLYSLNVDDELQQLDEFTLKLGSSPQLVEIQLLTNDNRVVNLENMGVLSIKIGNITYTEHKRNKNSVIFRLLSNNNIKGELLNYNGDIIAIFDIISK